LTAESRHKWLCEPYLTVARLWHEGASLIPTGKSNGKEPLVKLSRNRLPLDLINSKLQQNDSTTYGIRLDSIVVLDIDDVATDLVEQMTERFGETDFKVSTSRGCHLYYSTKELVRFNLRQEGLPIDVKSGANSYVIGPNSIRPDGVKYTFTGSKISLDKLAEIFAPRKQSKEHKTSEPNVISEGQRNKTLVTKAIDYAPCINSQEELNEKLLFYRDNYCINPATVPDIEVLKIAEWAWKKRLNNQLYSNTNSSFKIDRQAYNTIYQHPNGRAALELYVFLSDKHGHVIGKTFQINVKSLLTHHRFHFGERAMHQAINCLVELGYLALVKNYSAGKSGRLFQLSNPFI